MVWKDDEMILLAPHNDDETLFASGILLRCKPLVVVVTDCYSQKEKGITWEQRRTETVEACKILEVGVEFMGIPDTYVTEDHVFDVLIRRSNENVFVPTLKGGNKCHDLVYHAATRRYGSLVTYATYIKGKYYTPDGMIRLDLSDREWALKQQAMACYKSQQTATTSAKHFEAVGREEWISFDDYTR